MMVPTPPRFDWGQQVIAQVALYNDGSYPDCAPDALLVDQGCAGEVVQVGRHEESDTTVYLVEFSGRHVIGCLEQDLAPR